MTPIFQLCFLLMKKNSVTIRTDSSRKTVEIAFISGVIALLELAEHVSRQRILSARFDEVGDDDIVERDDEGKHQPGENTGPEQRQGDAAEGLPGVA